MMRRSTLILVLMEVLLSVFPAIATAPVPAEPASPPPDTPALSLRSGTLTGPGDDARLPARLLLSRASLAETGGSALLKFHLPVTPEAREYLDNLGAQWIAPLGGYAALVNLPPRGINEIGAVPGLAWAAPYHPGLRIGPDIAAVSPDDPRKVVPVTIRLLPGADVGYFVKRLELLGLPVRGSSPGRPALGRDGAFPARIVLTPTPKRLVDTREIIASWPETMWIGRRPSYRLLNDSSAWLGQSGLSAGQATPVYDNGIYGEGQVVGVLDTGLDADMCFFRDDTLGLPPVNEGFGAGNPDTQQRKVIIVNFLWTAEDPADPTDWDTQDHGTHVAGTVAGDNLATPGLRDQGDGMAPMAKIVMQDGGYGVDDCADMPALGCPAADLTPFFQQAYLQGARIHSNSYGDRENLTPYNIYSDGSEEADAFMWANPDFLLVFAAGNNGGTTETVASPATAKNPLSVGATGHGSSAGSMASFSSKGPTHDGRIKPDVTAPGSSVVSANNDGDINTDNCGTISMSGTSMACPTAAGLAALVREYFDKGFYPDGIASPPQAFTPSAALLRAAMISSATPMENLSVLPPSDEQGWGRVLLDDVLFFPGDTKRLMVADIADRFDSPSNTPDAYTLEILDGTEPLKVVATWTDYPSTPVAAVNLVNDLDLEIVSPGGTTYLGNVFTDGWSVAGGAADRINNVEVVKIDTPQEGTWTVRITPHAVPQSSQGYALVATGRMPAAGVVLERTSLFLDDSVGGDGDGVLEPGEWVDLPISILNSGDTAAIGVTAEVESLSPYVEVENGVTAFLDLSTGQEEPSSPTHLRVRMTTALPCTEPVALRFIYRADGYQRNEETEFPTGTEQVFLVDDFEIPNGWAHSPGESTGSTGDWTRGDPDGTTYQPEDDATPAPGVNCLFTATNGGGLGTDDVDDGEVVARSGPYDLSGHPEARVRISRWFANRDMGEDEGDFFRLDIRESETSADISLEFLGTDVSEPYWTGVTFRVADFVAPGPDVRFRVGASDGPATGNLVEAAIDEMVFWEPACDTWNPVPNPVGDLRIDRAGDDLVMSWSRPAPDPQHGETARYRVYRSEIVSSGYALQHETTDPGTDLSWSDTGAAAPATPAFYAYEVIPANDTGDGDTLP